jgi:hypothetical protein
MSTVALVIEL